GVGVVEDDRLHLGQLDDGTELVGGEQAGSPPLGARRRWRDVGRPVGVVGFVSWFLLFIGLFFVMPLLVRLFLIGLLVGVFAAVVIGLGALLRLCIFPALLVGRGTGLRVVLRLVVVCDLGFARLDEEEHQAGEEEAPDGYRSGGGRNGVRSAPAENALHGWRP